MKKVVLVLALLLFVFACQQQPTQPGSGQFYEKFRTGSEGLVISFVPDQPPTKIFDTDEVFFIINVENRGAKEVGYPGDRVYLSGFDPRILTGVPFTGAQIEKIEGKTSTSLVGGRGVAEFRATPSKLPTESYETPIVATACYSYETIAESNICLDSDPRSYAQRKVCTPQGVSLGTQGAPVSVSSVDISAVKGSATLKFKVRNAGIGDVFRFGGEYLTKCSPYVGLDRFNDLDRVQVFDVKVGGVSITPSCQLTDGVARLINNEATFTCKVDTRSFPTTGAVTTLSVDLRYGYRNQISRKLEVLRTPV